MHRRSTQYEQAQGGLGAVSPELRQLTERRSHEPKIRKPGSLVSGGSVSKRHFRIEMTAGAEAQLPAPETSPLPQGQDDTQGKRQKRLIINWLES